MQFAKITDMRIYHNLFSTLKTVDMLEILQILS